jgi:hypothetical protein
MGSPSSKGFVFSSVMLQPSWFGVELGFVADAVLKKRGDCKLPETQWGLQES